MADAQSRLHVDRQNPGSHAVGFTLVEVLITIAILSVGIVAVLTCFQRSLSALDRTKDRMCATELISSKFTELEQEMQRDETFIPVDGKGGAECAGRNFRWKQEVAQVAELADGSGDLLEINLTVWRKEQPDLRYCQSVYVRVEKKE